MENSAADQTTKGTQVGRTTCVFHPLALTQFRATDLTDINTLRFTLANQPVTFRTTNRCGEGSEKQVRGQGGKWEFSVHQEDQQG